MLGGLKEYLFFCIRKGITFEQVFLLFTSLVLVISEKGQTAKGVFRIKWIPDVKTTKFEHQQNWMSKENLD